MKIRGMKMLFLVFSLVLTLVFLFNVFASNGENPITSISIRPQATGPAISPVPTPLPTVRLITPTPALNPTPTPFSQMNVHMHNDTGKTANDLEIFIEGKVNVLKWWSGTCPFKDITWSYDPKTNITTIRFFNGIVNHCDRVDGCLWLDTYKIIEKYARKWSYDGVPYANTGATMSQIFQETEPGMVNLTLANTALDGGPMTIGIVQIGPGKKVYSLPELVWRNPALDQEIPWVATMNDIHLQIGKAFTLPAIPMPAGTVSVVYRAKVWMDADPANVVEYVGQYVPAQNITVLYRIISDWGSGATIDVKIINNTPMWLDHWTLEWTFPNDQIITNMWNATYTQTGAAVAVTGLNSSSNGAIPPNGGTVNFGFNVTYHSGNEKPASFMLNGIPCQTQ
ncbi:MAG: cellulose-binding domain-containing protein [Firmicutes bacterium]|nr:cellulose-binding domain-containing protein [Bacillota bacterium]